jgi:hypothetical protein
MKAKPPAIAAKHDDPDNQANQQPYGGHGKAGAPKAPLKGIHGVKIASVDEEDSDDDKIASVSSTKPALLQALAAAAIQGKVGARCQVVGGARMPLDDGVAAAAQFALRVEGRMPDDKARATLESLLGAKVVRRALAALRNDTNKEEEQDDNN